MENFEESLRRAVYISGEILPRVKHDLKMAKARKDKPLVKAIRRVIHGLEIDLAWARGEDVSV
jgi:hypothetical protein